MNSNELPSNRISLLLLHEANNKYKRSQLSEGERETVPVHGQMQSHGTRRNVTHTPHSWGCSSPGHFDNSSLQNAVNEGNVTSDEFVRTWKKKTGPYVKELSQHMMED
jgi:hypothetical protein